MKASMKVKDCQIEDIEFVDKMCGLWRDQIKMLIQSYHYQFKVQVGRDFRLVSINLMQVLLVSQSVALERQASSHTQSVEIHLATPLKA